MNDVRLDVYSWAGLSIGATHYYGDLTQQYGAWQDRKGHQHIQRPLSKKAATLINIKHRSLINKYGDFMMVHAGELDHRHETKADVVKTAKLLWKELFPDADRLILEGDVIDENT